MKEPKGILRVIISASAHRGKINFNEGPSVTRIDPSNKQLTQPRNLGALIIRIGFWGPEYYTYNTEPPKSIGDY